MGATRPASGFLRQKFTDRRVFSAACEPLLLCPTRDKAAEKCPTRDASPPLVVAFPIRLIG